LNLNIGWSELLVAAGSAGSSDFQPTINVRGTTGVVVTLRRPAFNHYQLLSIRIEFVTLCDN
jgi:hypothetical protein